MSADPSAPSATPDGTPLHVWPVLAVAVLAISAAAVIVRGLEGTDPLSIALWRTTLVGLILAPAIRPISRGDALRIALAGLCLGAHFAAWFASLQLTTVLRSTVLVCLGPVWTGLAEWVLQGQRPSARWWLGVALAIPGAALLGVDPAPGGSLLGDGLAVLGGLLGAAYFLLGRSVRSRVGIGTYGSLVCLAAAAGLLPAVLLTGAPLWGFEVPVWLAFLALALGPQMLGHNGFNYALRYLPASIVSVATLLEPAGATLLAWIFLGELPSVLSGLAGALAVGGVGVALTARRQ